MLMTGRIYQENVKVSDPRDQIACLASEVNMAEQLIKMGFTQSNKVNLRDRINECNNKISFLEKNYISRRHH